MANKPDYETRMGDWVEARCRKRAEEYGKPMPQEVRDWLDNGGNSPADGNTTPTITVHRWLILTIYDPDWDE
jgi:hypothetical protein